MRTRFSSARRAVAVLVLAAVLGRAQDQSPLEALADKLEAAGTSEDRAAILRGQPAPGADLFALCLRRGNEKIPKGDLGGARKSFEAALQVASQSGDSRGIGQAWEGIARSQRDLTAGEVESAFRKGLEASTAAGDKATMAAELRGLGRTYVSMGRLSEAKNAAQRARALYLEVGDRYNAAVALLTLSHALNESGDLEESAALLRQCVREGEEGKYTYILFGALTNLAGMYFEQNDYERALQYMQRAMQISDQNPNMGNRPSSYTNLAICFGLLGRYDQAFANYEKAIRLSRDMNSPGALAWALYNRGGFYSTRGEAQRALADLRPAAAFYAENTDRVQALQVLATYSVALLAAGDTKEALETAEKASREARGTGSPKLISLTLGPLGQAYLRTGDHEKARAAFLEAIAAVESARGKLAGGEDEKRNFFDNRVAPFHGMVRLFVEEGKPFEAFQYAERAKARLLLDVLTSGRAELNGAMTDAEKRRDAELSGAVVKLDAELNRSRDSARHAAALIEYQKASGEFESWRAEVYAAHPGLRLSRAEFQPIAESELTTLLPDARTALVEYCVTDYGVYVFAIARDRAGKPRLTTHRLQLTGDLSRQVEEFRGRLLSRDLGYRASAATLYNQLLAPVADTLTGKKLVVIVPDGALWNLPFQALISPAGRHVVEEAAVFYAPSLTAAREALRLPPASGERPRTLLAFGGPAASGGLPPLPESIREAEQLGQLYGRGASAVFTGAQATKERWMSEAPNYRILHLAAHGVLNADNPLYSYLALTPDAKAGDDGHLTAREILQMNLRAELAVLSACETARGSFRFGEGVIGMSWAFLVAGIPATVVSQWKVDSASTGQFMVAFHGGLRASSGRWRALALQEAALRLLHSPGYEHPFYWAGFVLIGNGY